MMVPLLPLVAKLSQLPSRLPSKLPSAEAIWRLR